MNYKGIAMFLTCVILARVLVFFLKPSALKLGKYIRRNILLRDLLKTEKDIRQYMKILCPTLEKYCTSATNQYYISFDGRYSIHASSEDKCINFRSVFYHSKISKKTNRTQYDFGFAVHEADEKLEIDRVSDLFVEAMAYNAELPSDEEFARIMFRDYFTSKWGRDLFKLIYEVDKCDGEKHPALRITNHTGPKQTEQNLQVLIRLDWVIRLIEYYVVNHQVYRVHDPKVKALLNIDPPKRAW